MKLDRNQTITLSWSTLTSIVGSLGAVWAFGAPIVNSALAGEITDQMTPLKNAFVITLEQNVRNLRNAVTAMEFKRDTCTPKPECWTLRDAQELVAIQTDLAAAEMALSGLKK